MNDEQHLQDAAWLDEAWPGDGDDEEAGGAGAGHGGDEQWPDLWVAHDQPERPLAAGVWLCDCSACALALHVAALHEPEVSSKRRGLRCATRSPSLRGFSHVEHPRVPRHLVPSWRRLNTDSASAIIRP